MVSWTRNRVVNFTSQFAHSYVELLVGLDGKSYDQALFFKFLADAKIVNDVSQEGSEEDVAERRRKRWDSYLGKIREFGIGFAVDEVRKGGQIKKSVWKASEVAKQFALGRIDYRQFVALQMMRFQLPRPTIPLQPQARKEIESGVRVRPLRLIIQALDELETRGLEPYLSIEEIFKNLAAVQQHDQLSKAIDAIATARVATKPNTSNAGDTGTNSEEETGDQADQELGQASQDIWLNELTTTGYVRQIRPQGITTKPPHLIVRNLHRWEEARRLDTAIPFQSYDTSEKTLNSFYDFFAAAPSIEEREVLMMRPRVIQLQVPAEVQFNVATNLLKGPMTLMCGLDEGTLLILQGDALDDRTKATVFEVTQSVSRPSNAEIGIQIKPVLFRTDGKPIIAR